MEMPLAKSNRPLIFSAERKSPRTLVAASRSSHRGAGFQHMGKANGSNVSFGLNAPSKDRCFVAKAQASLPAITLLSGRMISLK